MSIPGYDYDPSEHSPALWAVKTFAERIEGKCDLSVYHRPDGIFFNMNDQLWHIQFKGQTIHRSWPRGQLSECENYWREINEERTKA